MCNCACCVVEKHCYMYNHLGIQKLKKASPYAAERTTVGATPPTCHVPDFFYCCWGNIHNFVMFGYRKNYELSLVSCYFNCNSWFCSRKISNNLDTWNIAIPLIQTWYSQWCVNFLVLSKDYITHSIHK